MNNYYKGGTCHKAGIKIHETNNQNTNNQNINYTNNNNTILIQKNEKKNVDFFNTSLNQLDLNIENYSLNELFHLFNIHDNILTDENMKQAKQVVLKMHPDKSRLDSKYFLFFSKAYKQLFNIYEFQNKSEKKKYVDEDFYDETNKNVLNDMFSRNEGLKDGKNFNKWFNDSFEKHRLEDPNQLGYGDWLKSNDGFLNITESNITKSNMNEVFEKQKKQIQDITVYRGVEDTFFNSFGASSLHETENFTGDNYTDLRQAYTETLIPITNDDYEKIPKFKNVNEYQRYRETAQVTPLSKTEAEKILYERQKNDESNSASLAFKYAQESEKAKQSNNSFWADIKRLTGF
jgi:hypothetical protein